MAKIEAALPFAATKQGYRDPGSAADQAQRLRRRCITVIRHAERDRLACPHGGVPARPENSRRDRPRKRRQCSTNPTRPIFDDVIRGHIEEARPVNAQILADRFRRQVHNLGGIALNPLLFDKVQNEIPLGFRRD